MNLLTDNLKRTKGSILLDGEEILELGKAYRSKLGYMPQQNGYFDSFSVGMFLKYMAQCKGLDKKESGRQIDALLEKVNLSDKKNWRMDTLSGGMKQRVMLTQALLGNPDILILDEPTAGLDPKERIHIRNLILELSSNKCILLATHVVSDIESIADYILIMKKGELIAKGTPEELIADMFGKVCEVYCDKTEIPALLQQYPNANIIQTQQGVAFRVAGERRPKNAVVVNERINLEDVYLYYFQ
jgi:ABC-type multidrug transport system ATPase subunit